MTARLSAETELTPEEELGLFRAATSSIVRIEQQPFYASEQGQTWEQREQLWLDGEYPDPATDPRLTAWFDLMRELTQRHVSITRVRVIDDPPTVPQRLLRWLGRWNVEAGEQMRYISRPEAVACGLVPGVGPDDWWIFDNQTMLRLRFDSAGRFLSATATNDTATVNDALRWWPIAMANSQPETERAET